MILNLLFSAISFVLLFKLALFVLKDKLQASLVALIWYSAAPVINNINNIRHYELLSLVTIIFALFFIKNIHKPSKKSFFLLFLAVLAGFLTHLLFIFIAIGSFLIGLLYLKANKRHILWLLITLISGFIAFLLLHPDFFSSMRGQTLYTPFDLSETMPRLRRISASLFSFLFFTTNKIKLDLWIHENFSKAFILNIFHLTALFVLTISIFSLSKLKKFSRTEQIFFIFFICSYCSYLFVYMIAAMPSHVMEEQYMSVIWPLLTFLPVIFLKTVSKRPVIYTLLYIIILVIPLRFYDMVSGWKNTGEEWKTAIRKAEHVISDLPARGVFPQYLNYMNDKALVFNAYRNELAKRPVKWLFMLKPDDIIISDIRYDERMADNTAYLKYRKPIFKMLANEYVIQPLSPSVFKVVRYKKNILNSMYLRHKYGYLSP